MEVHEITGKVFRTVVDLVKHKFRLFLTATLPDDLDKLNFITSIAPVAIEIDNQLAVNNNYITDYVIYNLPVVMSLKEESLLQGIEESISENKQLFEGINVYNLSKEDVAIIAKENNTTVGNVYSKLKKLKNSYSERLEIFRHNLSKMYAIKELCEKLSSKKIIIFNVRIKTCNRLEKILPNSIAIHGKTDDDEVLLENYENNIYDILITTRKLSTGMDIPAINLGIVGSFTSESILFKQQVGRVVRLLKGKNKAFIICTVLVKEGYVHGMKNTSDLYTIEKAQSRIPKEKIKWVYTIDEIIEDVMQQ